MQPAEETLEIRREKIHAADLRLLALSAAILVFAGFYIWHNYRAAFPQASLNLKLGREEINSRATQFLQSRGLDPTGRRNLTLFSPDDGARLFLEREVGLEEANRLMSGDIVVWRWRARWYQPPEKEEFRVWLTPDGRVTGFDHVLAEDAPGARLSRDQARALAQPLIPAGYRLVEERTEERPKRSDHVFEWERDGFKIRDATYRRQVVVRGSEVASSNEYLKVPEKWEREFTALRSKNELFSQIAQAFYVPLVVAGLIVLIQGIRRREIEGRIIVRACLLIGGLMVLTEWNQLPFALDSLPTSTRVSEGSALALLQGIGAGVGVFFYVVLAAAPGELLYRRLMPAKLALKQALSWRGIETREFFRASVVGYALAGAHIAFVTAFYLIGRNYGVWSPQDVAYSDLLSTALPWIYPLTNSLLAASSEEAWFRLLAIPLLARLTGSRVIAIVVPAFVWGFLHANYPQQPAWIRGVEVGAIGLVAGVFLFRFGILATLVWHYTVDAVLMGSFLFEAQSWPFRAAGVMVGGIVMLPLALSIYKYKRNGGFLADPEMLNGAQRSPEPATESAPETPVRLAPVRPVLDPRLLYAVALLLGVLGYFAKPAEYGTFLRVALTREQALAAAGVPAPGEQAVADYLPNLNMAEFEYLRRQQADPDAVVREKTWNGLWRVRFFQPQRKMERLVYVSQDGKVVRTDLELDETAPGANLAQDQARAAAEHYLRGRGVDLSKYRALDASTEKLERRTDHLFVWEESGWRVGEAKARISLAIRGDQPSEYRRYLKLPENWEREFGRPRLQRYLVPAIAGGLGLLVLTLFVRNLGGHPFRWRRYAAVAALMCLLMIANFCNAYPDLWNGYDTATPPQDFMVDVGLGLLMRTLLAGLLAFIGVLALEVLIGPRRMSGGPWLLAPAMALAFAGAARIIAGAERAIPGDRFGLSLWAPPATETFSPGLAVLIGSLEAALAGTIAVALATAVAARFFTERARLVYAIIIAAAVALSRSDSPVLIAYWFLAVLLILGLASVIVRTTGGAVTALAGAIFLSRAIPAAAELIRQPELHFARQGWIALAATVLVYVWWARRTAST